MTDKSEEPRRILVVVDEPNVRMTLTEALEPLGYEIQAAASGEEAISAIADPKVELVLLDLEMPGVDGLQVLERIESERPGLQVVIVTAHGTVDSAVESMKHGALDFIEKPFALQQIRDLVRSRMDREERERETALSYEAHLDRARALIRDRRFDVAQEHVQEALAEEEARPEAFNLAGVLAWLRMDRSSAQKQWRLALDHDSTYGPAKRNLSRSTHRSRKKEPVDLGDETDPRLPSE